MSMLKKTPRSEVLSLRVSEEQRAILERYQEQLQTQLGRGVTLAEAAFLMIEDRAPRVDRVVTRQELAQTPTASLDRIRTRWESEHTLSLPEWDLLADYVQAGAEDDRQVPPTLQPAAPSRASYLALIDAFQAVYEERAAADSRHVWSYFANLAGYETDLQLSKRPEDGSQRHDALLRLLTLRRERLSNPTTWEYPGSIGRCLVTAIHEGGVESTTLDRVLAPYWSVLWRLAARGHWIRHGHQPVRKAGPSDGDHRRRFQLPDPLTAGDLRMSFASAGPELALQLTFGAQDVFHVVTSYPALVEFRAMLDAPADQSWHGRHFQAVVSRLDPTAKRQLWLAPSTAVGLTPAAWSALGDLYRRACASPDVQHWLDELAQEYGEHG